MSFTSRMTACVVGTGCALGLALAAHVAADQNAADLQPGDARPVSIGLYQNPSKIYRDPSGRPAGFFVELIERIAERERWQLIFVDCRWSRCLNLLRRGEIDLMPDVAFSAERDRIYNFNRIPVVQSWSQVYVRPSSLQWAGLGDLAGKRVATLEDSIQERHLGARVEAGDLDIELLGYPSFEMAFAAVRDDAADAAVTNQFFGQFFASEYSLVETPITFLPISLHFAAADGEQALLAAIDRHLQTWKSDADSPYYQALVRAYAGPQQPVLAAWLNKAIPFIALLVTLLIASTLILRWRVRARTRELVEARSQLELILARAPVVLYLLRWPEGRVEWVSESIRRVTGFSVEQASESGWWIRQLHPGDRDRIKGVNEGLQPGRTQVDEYRVLDAQGRIRYIRDEKRLELDPDNPARGRIFGSWNDLTLVQKHAARADYLRHHDRLTGLANRSRFMPELDRLLEQTRDSEHRYLVIVLDLDRFGMLNVAYGSGIADQVLIDTALRLSSWADRNDASARLGNDEFALALNLESGERPESTLERLKLYLAAPMQIEGREIVPTASIGAALQSAHGDDAETLIRNAMSAVDAARARGGNRWIMFTTEMVGDSARQLVLEAELRQALAGRQLILHFQPQIDLGNGALAGFEALVRWDHPEMGMISPGEFIPLAERTGLIETIDLYVLDAACAQLRDWLDAGFDPPRMAVNLSIAQLYNKEFPDHVRKCLTNYRLAGSALCVELTETMLMRNPDRVREVLEPLNKLGVRVSMDDFGSGYSNLAFLNRLPLQELKLDRSLVETIEQDRRQRQLVRMVLAMARELDLETVAEGIETEGQQQLLRDAGCSLAQGFLLARPMPAGQCAEFMQRASTDDQRASGRPL